MLGSQALTMTIAESVFDSNALRPPPDAPALARRNFELWPR